jgi:hypothetical protein
MNRQKQGQVGQLRTRDYRLKNHMTSKVEQLRGKRYSEKYHKTLEKGVRMKTN